MSSSWFGTGLSQITGQISNFTKEVLEEGTEEIDDPATQLKITRNKLIELDSYCQVLRAEIDRLKSSNDDLHEKLESSELQITAISNEYRVIVESKEKELKELKLQQNELYDLHSKTLDAVPSSSPPGIPHSSSMPSLHTGYQGDSQDFDDVITSQHEINRLRDENKRLEAETRHWKQRCQSNASQVTGEDTNRIHDLETHIKELRQQYDDEIDQHQRELAALQDVHGQKLATLKRKNKDEITHLHEELGKLQDEFDDKEGTIGTKELQCLKDKVQHLEAINDKLTVDLELTHAADREKARCLDDVKEQLQTVTNEREKLLLEKTEAQTEKDELMHQLDVVVTERRRMSTQYQELSAKLQEQGVVLREAQGTEAGQGSLKSLNHLSSTPLKHGKQPKPQLLDSSDLDELHDEPTLANDVSNISPLNASLVNQVEILNDKISTYEMEIRQFDLIKSDWQMEKEALEDVLLKLREQLRDREEQLNVVQAQKGMVEFTKQQMSRDVKDSEGLLEVEMHRSQVMKDTSPDMDVTELSQQVELLTQNNSQLEQECDMLTVDKDNLVKLIEEQKLRLTQFESEQTVLMKSWEKQISTLEQELITKHSTLSTLTMQLKQKSAELDNLSAELETNTTTLIEQKATIQSLEKKFSNHDSMASEVEAREVMEFHEQLQAFEAEKLNLTSELVQKTSEIELISNEKSQAVAKIETLIQEINDLKPEKEKLTDTIKKMVNDRDLSSQEVASLEEERDSLIVSLEELDAQHEAAISQIISTRDKLSDENDQLRLNISGLETKLLPAVDADEVEELKQEMTKLRMDRDKFQVTVNDFQMTNQELTEARAKLKEEKKSLSNKLHEVSSERNQLQSICDKLRQETTSITGQSLNGKAIVEEQSPLELQSLNKELEQQKAENQKYRLKIVELENFQQKRAISDVAQLKLSEQFESEMKQLRVDHTNQISKLTSTLKCLQEEKIALEKELNQAQQDISNQQHQFEQCSQELEVVKNINTDSLQREKLLKVAGKKDEQISGLEQEALHGELDTTDKTAHETTTLSETGHVQETAGGTDRLVKKQIAELDRLYMVEEQYKQASKDNKCHRVEIEHLKELVRQLETKETSAKGSGLIADLELELDSLRERFMEQDEKMMQQKEEIKSLRDTVSKYESDIAELNLEKKTLVAKMEELLNNMVQQDTSKKQQHLTNGDAIISHEKSESTVSNKERLKENYSVIHAENNVMPNGDITYDDFHSNVAVEEFDKLKKLVLQKDTVISQLNDNNSSLLTLLEERSQAVYNDDTLLDIHRLGMEVQGLRAEKDQMMSILNEKTRECSSLKGEVHRLMSVISAEKMALSKLQQDNHDLMQNNDESTEKPNEDMKQDAIKKLSQIIRDKDLEIEALNQKNHTLLEVLQESSQEGLQLSALIREKDNLVHQIKIFQADREQIITALNAKHKESVAYHDEMQRLRTILSTESQKQEQLQTNYESLRKQYEDKQQALVKMQNEMLNYKRKYSELDIKHKELQRYRESSGNPTPRSSSPTLANVEATAMQTSQSPTSSLSNFAQEMDDLKAVIKSHEGAFIEKDQVIQGQNSKLLEKDRAIWERDAALSQKDKLLSELHSKMHRTEEAVHSKDSEISTFKKQSDNLAFQLKGIQMEFGDLRSERDQLYERNSVLQQELGAMKEANNRLMIIINDKEFEINALKEKMKTLSKLMEQQGMGEKGEMDRMMKETETLQQQAQGIKQERDQSMLALQQQQTENQQLRNEIQRLNEKGKKQLNELERLRGHLLSIEENYTQDALGAEEREKELRNRLANAEEKAFSSSSAVQAANEQALKQVDALQMQLHALAEQRDSALMQLASAQETANQYATSLQNLQMVLEQFQMERETQQNAEIEKYLKDLLAYKNENINLLDQIRQLQAQVDDTSDALEAAQRLSEQLDRKEEMISALRAEVQLRESELMKSEMDIKKLSSSTEAKVDKVLMKNLLLGYFHTPTASRVEALHLLGRMLDFTPSDMEEIGVDGRQGWFGGLFKKSRQTPPTTPKSSPNKSFSELFVTFLERESSPQPSLLLPTDRMVAESQRRHSHSGKTSQHTPTNTGEPLPMGHTEPTFNPFSAPVNTTLPLHINTDREAHFSSSNHPLMKPITPSLPLFAPSTPGSSSNLLIASSGSTTNSGSILRDVLQQ